jgi:hypothetical protein
VPRGHPDGSTLAMRVVQPGQVHDESGGFFGEAPPQGRGRVEAQLGVPGSVDGEKRDGEVLDGVDADARNALGVKIRWANPHVDTITANPLLEPLVSLLRVIR